jgi:hypothetical protein
MAQDRAILWTNGSADVFVWFADPEWSIMPAENPNYVIN